MTGGHAPLSPPLARPMSVEALFYFFPFLLTSALYCFSLFSPLSLLSYFSLAVMRPPNPARGLCLWETGSAVAAIAGSGAELRPQRYFCNILIPRDASGDNYIGSFSANKNVTVGANLAVFD